jgi:hypothetical protein
VQLRLVRPKGLVERLGALWADLVAVEVETGQHRPARLQGVGDRVDAGGVVGATAKTIEPAELVGRQVKVGQHRSEQNLPNMVDTSTFPNECTKATLYIRTHAQMISSRLAASRSACATSSPILLLRCTIRDMIISKSCFVTHGKEKHAFCFYID